MFIDYLKYETSYIPGATYYDNSFLYFKMLRE